MTRDETPGARRRRRAAARRPLCAALLLLALAGAGCSSDAPKVDLDSPERAAESVGRVLCAEHQARIEAIGEQLERALAIQTAKAQLIANRPSIERVNERLHAFAEFFDEHEDALARCTIVLTDLVTVNADSRVRVSLQLELEDWTVDSAGKPSRTPRSVPVLLTLTRLDGEWKVTESSLDFSLPGGALGGLLVTTP